MEASAVGEHGSRKAIKLVQPTRCFEYFQSGTQIEVVGIAQDDLRFHLVQNFMGVYAFHCAQRADRHKYRRLNLPMIGGDQSGTCLAACVVVLQFKKATFFAPSGTKGKVILRHWSCWLR